MFKRILVLSTLLIAWFTLPAQVNFNGNLEKIDKHGRPEGWTFSFDKEQTYKVELDSLVKRQGMYSVSITAQDGKADYGAINHLINQSFHGKHLTLVGSIKTEDVNDGFAALWLRVNGTGKKVIAYENMEKNGIKGTNDWREYHIKVPYNEHDAVSINAGALLVGKGKIWIDSLRLYLDDELIEKSVTKNAPFFAGELDTAFSKGSGIDTILLTKKNSSYLNLLGQLWGFLKYHHPAIAKGNYNWDAELMRVLPLVSKCESNNEASVIFDQWIDKFEKPSTCSSCISISEIKDISIKPNYGHLFNNKIFSSATKAKLKHILANVNSAPNAYHYYVNISEGPVKFTHEKPYSDMEYPDIGFRMLSLFRYWNMIQYFFPNRHLISEGWENILSKYIPYIINAKDNIDYAVTMQKLIANIHDTHAAVGGHKVIERFKGAYRVPFQAKFIEDKLVVTAFYKDTLEVKTKFKVGDIIATINGIKTEVLLQNFSALIPASNREAKLRDLPGSYLLRSNNPTFKFGLLRNGEPIEATVYGVKNTEVDFFSFDYYPDSIKSSYSLLSKEIGYLFAGKYKNEDLEKIKKEFLNTKGIIVDMRTYPIDEMAFTFGNYIKPFTSAFTGLSSVGSYPGLVLYKEFQKNGQKSIDNYKGRVVVLVNALTQSNAEWVTMAFQSSPNVTVIGSTTAGADGNIANIDLPGGISAPFSAIGVFYPDGTNAQRKGVKIDHYVKPTIKGIKEGRDEVLEMAQELIVEDKKTKTRTSN